MASGKRVGRQREINCSTLEDKVDSFWRESKGPGEDAWALERGAGAGQYGSRSSLQRNTDNKDEQQK
jgi:hypothetical protein